MDVTARLVISFKTSLASAKRAGRIGALVLVAVVFVSRSSAPAADARGANTRPAYAQAPEKTNDGWDTADLESEHVDAKLIGELLSRIRDNTYTNIHSVLLVKNGKLVVEEYFTGRNEDGQEQAFTRDTLHGVYSVTKSVNSTLIGIAIDQHLIKGPEQRISELLPSYGDLFKDKQKASLRLRDLLSMTAGLSWDEDSYPYTDARNDHSKMNGSSDCIRYVLEKPMTNAPGRKFVYNSGLAITLGKILHQASGLPADEFAERYLFGPLGITNYFWYKYPNGVVQTGGGLSLRPRDMAKIGVLFLNGGRWQGKRILSERWVKASTKPQTGGAQPPIEFAGYGFQWWLCSFQMHHRVVETFAALGRGGQFIVVVPELQTVVVFTGWNDNALMHQPFDILYHYILPALMPTSTGRSGELTKPLALPEVTAGAGLSAAELLQKALAARGGTAAASNVRSFRAQGTVDLDNWLLAPSPVEFAAVRPDKYREAIDAKTSAGREVGQYGQGFDGQTGWDAQPGAALRALDGKLLDQRREDAEFFAWYDEPASYRSAEVLGEASFGDQQCYALSLVTKSGLEEIHYYNKSNFLLAGLMARVETDAGPAWSKTSFGEYRPVGGFRFPMFISVWSQSGTQPLPRCISVEFSSIEINRVEDSAVKMPSGRTSLVRKVNQSISHSAFDAIVGRYDCGGSVLTIAREGDRIFAQLTGQDKCEIFPESETEFFCKAVDAQATFVKDQAGRVTKAFLHQNGQTTEAPKLP
jgi:CubicO group peptidase (beta-lactamase class C family)